MTEYVRRIVRHTHLEHQLLVGDAFRKRMGLAYGSQAPLTKLLLPLPLKLASGLVEEVSEFC